MAQDSSQADFWDTRYRAGVTPWDARGVPSALMQWLCDQPVGTVLIPGCGAAYEVRAFVERGHEVTAIEISDAAIDAATRALGALAGCVRKADFFTFDSAPFDLVYERAFLCALPRRLWAAWSERMRELIRPGGRLAGFFYFDDNERGPPFGISAVQLTQSLGPAFRMSQDAALSPGESLPVFKGKERWQVWERRL